jgi:hypothetical protein
MNVVVEWQTVCNDDVSLQKLCAEYHDDLVISLECPPELTDQSVE